MQKKNLIVAAVAGCTALGSIAAGNAAAAVATVAPALAPNSFGSPSWTPWISNLESAMESGTTSAGTTGTPSYYSQLPAITTLNIGDMTVTNFNSWRGDANPTATYGPAYGSELGNRLTYGVHVLGGGVQFSISQLSFNYFRSTYSAVTPEVSVAAGGYNYNVANGYVGLNYGLDGIKGTADDVLITGGANTQLVDELYARGSGIGYQVLDTDPGTTNQDKLNYSFGQFGGDFTATGIYSLNGIPLATSTALVSVPEPTTFGLIGVAAVGLLRRRRRTA